MIVSADTIYQGDDSDAGFGRRPAERATQALLADTIHALSGPSTTVLVGEYPIVTPVEGELKTK